MILTAAAQHAGHADPVILALIGLAAAGFYALKVLTGPTRRCPRCKGTRVIRRGRRPVTCPRCRATGCTRWPGAAAVHRFYWSVLGERARRARERGQAQHPERHPGPPDGR